MEGSGRESTKEFPNDTSAHSTTPLLSALPSVALTESAKYMPPPKLPVEPGLNLALDRISRAALASVWWYNVMVTPFLNRLWRELAWCAETRTVLPKTSVRTFPSAAPAARPESRVMPFTITFGAHTLQGSEAPEHKQQPTWYWLRCRRQVWPHLGCGRDGTASFWPFNAAFHVGAMFPDAIFALSFSAVFSLGHISFGAWHTEQNVPVRGRQCFMPGKYVGNGVLHLGHGLRPPSCSL